MSTGQWASANAALDAAHALRLRAEELVDADANAYMSFVEASRAAKGLRGAARERSVKPAREATVDVPLAIVRLGVETVELAGKVAAHGNPNLRADATVAATIAAAGATAASRLIASNLAGGRDPRLDEARRIVKTANGLADALGNQP